MCWYFIVSAWFTSHLPPAGRPSQWTTQRSLSSYLRQLETCGPIYSHVTSFPQAKNPDRTRFIQSNQGQMNPGAELQVYAVCPFCSSILHLNYIVLTYSFSHGMYLVSFWFASIVFSHWLKNLSSSLKIVFNIIRSWRYTASNTILYVVLLYSYIYKVPSQNVFLHNWEFLLIF